MKNYLIPHFMYKRFGDKYLVTTDIGSWTFISRKELIELERGKLGKELLDKLEKSLIVVTDDNAEKVKDKKHRSYWYRSNGTSLHIIIPTLRCNFSCRYCYAFRRTEDQKGFDMTPEIADAAVDFIFQSPAPSIAVEFSGGEPALNFDIVKRVILKVEEKNKEYDKEIDFAFVTNGSLLDDEKVDFLIKHKVGICFSFDGPRMLNDYHRFFTVDRKKSVYDMVVSKIKWIREEKKYSRIFAIPVITKHSFKYWKEIIDEYIKLGLKVYRFKYLSFFGFASNLNTWKDLGYTPEEFVKYWKETVEYLIELNKKGIRVAENILLILLSKLIGKQDPGFAEMQTPCGAVTGQIVYNYDGKIYTCDEARTLPEFAIGNVMTSTYEEVLQHPTTKAMIEASSLVESCYDCPYHPFCGVCPLENYNINGTFVANIPNSYRCKIHKAMFDFTFDKLAHDEEFRKIAESWIKKGFNQK